jgi:hypothetical protein
MSVSRLSRGVIVSATGPNSTWDLTDNEQFIAAVEEDAETERELEATADRIYLCPHQADHYVCLSGVEDFELEASVLMARCSCGATIKAKGD